MGQISTTSSTERCATSKRCRQPIAFSVTVGSWPSVVCEKHLGLLASRLLSGDLSEDRLTVRSIDTEAGA